MQTKQKIKEVTDAKAQLEARRKMTTDEKLRKTLTALKEGQADSKEVFSIKNSDPELFALIEVA